MSRLKKISLDLLLVVSAYTPVFSFLVVTAAIYSYWQYPSEYFEWYGIASAITGNGILWLFVYFFAYYRGHYKFCKHTLIALYGLLIYNLINLIDTVFGLCLLDYFTFFWMVGFGGTSVILILFTAQVVVNLIRNKND